MADWFAMGGHAAFIWPAWGATVLGLGALSVWIIASYMKAKRDAAALVQGDQ